MKIAMVDPAAYSLPYDTALCEALARAGHDVTLHTTRFAHGEMPAAEGYRIDPCFYRQSLRPLPRRVARGLQHPRDLHKLCRRLRRERPDVVHVQWSVVHRVDVPVWRRLELPVVFTAHNAVGRREALDCELLRQFDAVVAHSEAGAARLREECSLPRVWQVPHGAFDSYADTADPDPLPLALGSGPVVALTGLLRPYKGVDVLLDAWPRVRERVPDAELVIAGRPMGVELPADPPPGVHLLPRFLEQDEFGWLVRRADVVCLPYREVDLSGVLFSAIAVGTPLLLSDVGGFRELAGQGAAFAPAGDAAALADALATLLGDPGRREQLAGEARTAARERYSWDAIAARYTELYGELVSAPAG